MRYILKFLIPFFCITAAAPAHHGVLKQDSAGFTYVDLDDRYIYDLIEPLKVNGFEDPPYFGPGLHGAHISVISAQEAIDHDLLGKISQVGSAVYFKIGTEEIVNPPSQPDSEFYILTVESPYLDLLRKEHGLLKSKYPFHITVGVKKINRVAS